MPSDREPSFCALCGVCVVQILVLMMMMLLLAYALLFQVTVTVSDASLSRFALNGTALAYDLSRAVAVQNPNWAMRAEHAAPLDAELLFVARRFTGARLVDAGRSVGPEKSSEVRLRVAGEADNAAELLGSDDVAELVKETVAGEIQSLELKLSGKVRYRPVHVGSYRLAATWPLRLPTAAPGISVVVRDEVINIIMHSFGSQELIKL